MRILLDTNVLVAAFATRGLCLDILQLVLAEHRLVFGETIVEELERILAENSASRMRASDMSSDSFAIQAEVVAPVEPASWPDTDPEALLANLQQILDDLQLDERVRIVVE